MKPFIISTETTADLPERFLAENNILVHPLFYIIDDITYGQDVPFLDPSVFYEKMKSGIMPTTSASNPESVAEKMTAAVEAGYDILHIAFSSGLSSSCQSAVIAAQEVMDAHPDARITVIDSLAASSGQGLMVYHAVRLQKEGKSLEETAAWLQEHLLHFVHAFTVDDLFHLYRGGRLSKTTAILGSALKIKPLLHVDDAGHLVNIGKIRNRQKVLLTMAKNMEENIKGFEDSQDIIYISHSGCYEDARFLADQITAMYGYDNIVITDICPTIGSHTGTGCVALFYMGQKR